MDFFLFVLVNAALFIRPGEIFPDLEGWPVYQWLILAALAVSGPRVVDQLTARSLRTRPVTVCVLGVWAAIVLSHLTRMATAEAATDGFEFGKVVLYYLLLVGVLDTPGRLRTFLPWLGLFVVGLAGVAVLQYHGVVDLQKAAAVLERHLDRATGLNTVLTRICGVGIFNDPNDLCLALTLGTFIGLYQLECGGGARLLWLGPLVLFLYALELTQSRGGLLGFAAGLVVLCGARFGWRRAVPLTLLLVPALLLVASDRQTSFDVPAEEDTGMARLRLWSEALANFRQYPLFGVGSGHFAEKAGLVAHNSFVHGFAELGFFGGALFVGACYAAVASLARLGPPRAVVADPALRSLRPYLLAAVAASLTGQLTLSRNYVVPTYLVLGLAQAYAARARTVPAGAALSTAELGRRLVPVGAATVAGTYLVIRLFARWG